MSNSPIYLHMAEKKEHFTKKKLEIDDKLKKDWRIGAGGEVFDCGVCQEQLLSTLVSPLLSFFPQNLLKIP